MGRRLARSPYGSSDMSMYEMDRQSRIKENNRVLKELLA